MKRSLCVGWMVLVVGIVGAPAAAQEVLPQASGDVSPEQVLQQAEMFAKKREYAKAESAYEEVLKRDPKQAGAWAGLAKVYHRNKQWDKAAALLERGRAELGEGWSEGTYLLAYTQRKAGKPSEAVALYTAFLAQVKDDPDGVYGLAASYEEAGQDREAVDAYKRYVAVEKRPSEQKWVEKAREQIASLEGKLKSAAPIKLAAPAEVDASGQKGEAAGPVKVDVASLRAEGERAFGAREWPAAARAWRQVAAAEAEDWEIRYKLGVALALAGELGGAIAAWEEVLALKPGMQAASNNVRRARAKLAASSEEGVDDPRLEGSVEEQVALAEEYLQAGRGAMALRAADRALLAAPEDARGHRARGLALLQLARYAEASEPLGIALGKRPGDGELTLALGQCAVQSGEPAKAAWLLRRGLERLDPTGTSPDHEATRALLARLEGLAAAR